MSQSLSFRPYQPGDEVAILELFRRTFDNPMTPEYWNWRFRDNPAAGPMAMLAWDGTILAAHYAVSPVTVYLSGASHLTALSMTTMTHPAYRGQGLFTKLATELYERMAKQGYVIVWGFPNDQSHRGFIRDLAWEDICEIPMFRFEMNSRKDPAKTTDQVIEFKDFDQRFDRLWERVRSDYAIVVQRDQKYLTWRFTLDPHNSYRRFCYVEDTQVLGYAVYKTYQTDLDIVDLFTVRDSAVGRELIRAIIDLGSRLEIRGINLWLPVRHFLHHELEKLGFHNSAPVTYFGGRILQPGFKGLDLADPKRWQYSMSDSDVF